MTLDPTASKSPHAWIVLLLVSTLGALADLWTKSWAFANVAGGPINISKQAVIEATQAGRSLGELLPSHPPKIIIPHGLELTLVLNRGAVFGMGSGGRWVFIAFTLVAFVFALWVFARWTTSKQWLTHASLGLVLAGGIGNLYDRIRFACVRDFLHPLPDATYPFGISTPWSGDLIWPYVSNVADALLLVGIGYLMIALMRADQPIHSKSTPDPKPADNKPSVDKPTD